jgi:hypothetical protein
MFSDWKVGSFPYFVNREEPTGKTIETHDDFPKLRELPRFALFSWATLSAFFRAFSSVVQSLDGIQKFRS